MTTRTYDIVIWGATGFTGRLVMAYMAKTYGVDGEIKWAVAGRNAAKLAEVKRQVLGAEAEKLPEVIADSNDEASLRTLVSRHQGRVHHRRARMRSMDRLWLRSVQSSGRTTVT